MAMAKFSYNKRQNIASLHKNNGNLNHSSDWK